MRTPKDRSTNIYRNVDEHGYEVLHATRGWRRVTLRRLHAQRRMAQLKGLL